MACLQFFQTPIVYINEACLAMLSSMDSSNCVKILQTGVKSLAHLLSRAGVDNLLGVYEGSTASSERDEAKKLDVIAVRSLLSTRYKCS